jgi:galactose mutarotase-like enzyme
LSKDKAIAAVKDFIKARAGKEKDNYQGKFDVLVNNGKESYLYKNVSVSLYYEVKFKQFTVNIVWEDDSKQKSYDKLGLHGVYNTNFQTDMVFVNNSLNFSDGDNKISITLN